VTCISIARQRLRKYISAGANARSNRTSFARQRISKHTSLTTEAVFSAWFVQNGYKEVSGSIEQHTRVEAGSNTSTVTLRVVGVDENGSLKFETVKYDHEFQGTWTRERLTRASSI
jgi:hypothetical protein